MDASIEDSQDGLTAQNRLDSVLPMLPAGVMEMFFILLRPVRSIRKEQHDEMPFRLRLHSNTGVYDFPFSVLVEAIEEPKPEEMKRKIRRRKKKADPSS